MHLKYMYKNISFPFFFFISNLLLHHFVNIYQQMYIIINMPEAGSATMLIIFHLCNFAKTPSYAQSLVKHG